MGRGKAGAALLLGLFAAAPARADDTEILADIHWAATYTLTQLEPGHTVQIGTVRGLFVDEGAGPLHWASVVCPYLQADDATIRAVSILAYCIATTASGDQAFLNFGCAGNAHTEGCEGVWSITGGTGRLAGITGEGGVAVWTLVVNPDGISAVGITQFTGFYRGFSLAP